MIELDQTSVESSEMVEQTFKFWFTDNEHIRSPFPSYIQDDVKKIGTQKFFEWASNLNPKAKDEVNDEILSEKFEEFIFEAASALVMTEDEKITIEYPFLPRLNDEIFENRETQTGKSSIIDREILKEGDDTFMKIKLEKLDSKEKWETQFELPK